MLAEDGREREVLSNTSDCDLCVFKKSPVTDQIAKVTDQIAKTTDQIAKVTDQIANTTDRMVRVPATIPNLLLFGKGEGQSRRYRWAPSGGAGSNPPCVFG